MSLFNELYHINVNEHTEKVKSGKSLLTYLSWSWAWAEIKKVDPLATKVEHEFPMLDSDFKPIAEGLTVPYLKTPEGYFVKVSVTINGHTETEMLPVTDNQNVSLGTIAPTWVKKNGPDAKSTREYAQTPTPTSMDINTSLKRCMVKAIALHGLGLYIYAGEDVPEVDPAAAEKEEQERLGLVKQIRDIQRQTQKTKSEKISSGLDAYVQELQAQAKAKVENMKLVWLQKVLLLVNQKLDQLELADNKEEVKA